MCETPLVMHELPPIVFIGPTASREDVLSVLPDALVARPCRRGDLYRYRILKHSIFLIIDGVFGGSLAVPPREVIDVIKDGAVVIGASSMGALRSADCYPAGALGIGIVYRLYRRRAISSEDEVAVTFREDRPYPSLTDPLINIRVALRRAVNLGVMTTADGVSIVAAAKSTHYSHRTWSAAFKDAGVIPPMATQEFLKGADAKRQDAKLAFRRLEKWLRTGALRPQPPKYGPGLFGLLDEGRERGPDPLDGTKIDAIRDDLVAWIVVSGYIHRMHLHGLSTQEITSKLTVEQANTLWAAISTSFDFDAALTGFNVFNRAVREARRLGISPEASDLQDAELELACAHQVSCWNELATSGRLSTPDLAKQRDLHALTKSLRRILFPPASAQEPMEHQPQWERN
ncbi:MAG: hypothetical protein EOS06_25130 [Mesorhizobium sp.]|nr:MAG: hypothetical protein EOS06_25130 [Mesorhizobium sp.]RWO76781.1 MAG: hypothetical protein EOS18_23790 [Mesorhizobium sp.]